MSKRTRILSLFVVFLMMAAASVSVNKSLFGHGMQGGSCTEASSGAPADSVTVLPDGTTVIHTGAMSGTISGYAGTVPLDIHIKDNRITGIQPLENTETPAFFKRAAVILEQWIGKTPAEAEALKVDAVSGATYSSNAIINNVGVGLAAYDGEGARNTVAVPVKIWIALGVTLAACVLPLFVRNKVYHTVQMVANVVVLGFWTGQFLDYSLMLKYTSAGFTWPTALIAVAMLAAAFIYPLFGRPQHYCSHICPLGSAQQLMAEICGYKVRLSRRVVKGLDWFRKLLWAALMLLLWADSFVGWMDLELFQAFQFESASAAIIIAACVFVLLSAVVARPYCRFVCPTGSLFKRAENLD